MTCDGNDSYEHHNSDVIWPNNNGDNRGLSTFAIRPSGVIGTTSLPTLVAEARQGKLKHYAGQAGNVVVVTKEGNLAQTPQEVTGCAC